MPELVDTWRAFRDERAVSLCATSLASDYKTVERWLERCPVQDLQQGRDAIIWVLNQNPRKSAIRVGQYVKSLYRWAASEDVRKVAFNPVASVKFPKAPQGDDEVTVIPREEMPFVMAALKRKRKGGAKWHHWAQFMLQTGMRTGEVRAVHEEDVKGDKLLVHRNHTLTHGLKDSTKTNKKRWVPLNPVAREILDQLTPIDGWFFPWNRYSFQSFFYARMGELEDLDLVSTQYRPYDLRHTAITSWLEAGVPVAQAASWAGNTAEVIWKHYAGATDDYAMPVL